MTAVTGSNNWNRRLWQQ